MWYDFCVIEKNACSPHFQKGNFLMHEIFEIPKYQPVPLLTRAPFSRQLFIVQKVFYYLRQCRRYLTVFGICFLYIYLYTFFNLTIFICYQQSACWLKNLMDLPDSSIQFFLLYFFQNVSTFLLRTDAENRLTKFYSKNLVTVILQSFNLLPN